MALSETIRVCLDGSDRITADSPEPDGYTQRIDWAKMQHKAGRFQQRCEQCRKFYWPHLGCKCKRAGEV